MNPKSLKMQCALALFVAGILAAAPSMADKPEGKGKGKEKKEQRDDDRGGKRSHFDDKHRHAVRDYYDEQFRGGRCPPGLAKKHNGCMPPGQAKKWNVGRPLPREVRYYEVPQPLVVQIGPPPSGYRYVRVASDILMISVRGNIVADVIVDFGR